MPPKKPLTSVLKRDHDFGAKVVYGPRSLEAASEPDRPVEAAPPPAEAKPAPLPPEPEASPPEAPVVPVTVEKPAPEPLSEDPPAPARDRPASYSIAVSLTPAMAARAEAWAAAARCTVSALVRRVARSVSSVIVEEWIAGGFPDNRESKVKRGKHTTSVSVAIPPDFAEAVAREHDPFDMFGVARVVASPYRDAFERHFDKALTKAGF